MHNIIIKPMIDQKDYLAINKLKDICYNHDGISLKLELDYKLKLNNKTYINEFFYYIEEVLVGYIGISQFSGNTCELNGMVHPEHRRRGIFKTLFKNAIRECQNRNAKILLLTDARSTSGIHFIENNQGIFVTSEFEMYSSTLTMQSENIIQLVPATNMDAKNVYDQDKIYFSDLNTGEYDKTMLLPEEEIKKGLYIYLAYHKQEIVGKVHLTVENKLGAIYGLGILPEHRRKGYGKNILLESIKILASKGSNNVMLQVVSSNMKALDLYIKCGFEVQYEIKYYSYI